MRSISEYKLEQRFTVLDSLCIREVLTGVCFETAILFESVAITGTDIVSNKEWLFSKHVI
jgi:hypothetical protein